MRKNWRDIDIRLAAVLCSLLLSWWHVALNPIPNADAFEYVRAAHVYLDEGIAAAFAWYPAATYPVLMGALHRLTGIDLLSAGQLINALFYALLVYSFIALVQEIRDTRRIALLAAIVVLVFPTLNEYRYYLIRDIGFLAFMLSGALQLTRYSKTYRWPHGALFILFTCLAALLRGEALVYLPLVPLALLTQGRESWGRQVRALLTIEAALLALAVLGLFATFVLGIDILGTLQRMLHVYWPFLRDAMAAMGEKDSALSRAVFGEYAANFSGEYIWVFMLSGLTAVLVVKLISGFGVPALALLFWGAAQHRTPIGARALRPVLAYALVSFAIILSFLLLTRFLSSRYTLLFTLSCLVLLPNIIDETLTRLGESRYPRLLGNLLWGLLAFSAVDAHISFGDSKTALHEASDWLQENTQAGDSVLTNSPYVAYFSGRVAEYDLVLRYLAEDAIENAPYGAVLVLTTSSSIRAQIQRNLEFQRIEFVTAFPHTDEPDVLIYKRLGN